MSLVALSTPQTTGGG